MAAEQVGDHGKEPGGSFLLTDGRGEEATAPRARELEAVDQGRRPRAQKRLVHAELARKTSHGAV